MTFITLSVLNLDGKRVCYRGMLLCSFFSSHTIANAFPFSRLMLATKRKREFIFLEYFLSFE